MRLVSGAAESAKAGRLQAGYYPPLACLALWQG